jgi:hypothetical protein
MKKLFLIFLFLIVHCTLYIENCSCQLPPHYYWRQVTSPSNDNLNYVSFSGTYFIAGNNGTILYSDNGLTFYRVQGLRSENFNCIEYTYLPSFTAVGQKGIIYSVTNPPITVSREISGTTNNLMSVSGNRPYYNPLMINRFAVGSNGTLIKSTRTLPGNWGPWNPINSGTTQNLNSIDFFPDSYSGQNSFSYGCIVGDNGIILRTTNWGDNWSIINTGITNKLNYVHFTDTMT